MSRSAKRLVLGGVGAGIATVAGLVALSLGSWGALPAVEAKEGTPVGGGVKGVWTAERSRWRVEKGATATLVELSLRRVGGHGHWNSSETLPLTDLKGLTAEMLEAASSDVRFEWVKDAGTFACQGRFETGVGAGHFVFSASPDYAADMKRRGYGEIDEEKSLSLALHDVSRAFIDELAKLGYERVPLDDLVSLRIHGVTPDFIRGMASRGYRKLTTDQLTSLRIHGASLEFVNELQSLGYSGLPIDGLVSFRIHGVSAEYIRAFKELGYEALTADQLVSMRIHGVTPEFAKELGALGYSKVAVDDLVSLRIHGVTTDFVKRVQGRSGKSVSVDQLVSMRIHGQNPE
jgi:hypothetical protein